MIHHKPKITTWYLRKPYNCVAKQYNMHFAEFVNSLFDSRKHCFNYSDPPNPA